MEERLQKILARAGLGSRRACDALIAEGRGLVNGQPAVPGTRADPAHDDIVVDGQRLRQAEPLRYVMLNKPRGVVSSLNAQGSRQTVRDLVPLEGRLYPVGRLDADSEGLILLTNDGELTDHLTHPRYESEKEYRVLVKGIPDDERLAAWRRGVILEGKRTAPANVVREQRTPAGTWLRVIMHEGRKHQIRDIGLLLGLPVRRLLRVRMGGLRLGSLAEGEWRELRPEEVQRLRGPGSASQPSTSPRAPRPPKVSGSAPGSQRERRASVPTPARRPDRSGRPPRPGSAPSRRPRGKPVAGPRPRPTQTRKQ
jgi:23S rRNA pseudouridine2605 synthase